MTLDPLGWSHSAAAARTLRDGQPFVGAPGASRLFGGRWRRGSPRLRFGGYDACSSRANASAAPSRLFSAIAPGATVWIWSNTWNGSATPYVMGDKARRSTDLSVKGVE